MNMMPANCPVMSALRHLHFPDNQLQMTWRAALQYLFSQMDKNNTAAGIALVFKVAISTAIRLTSYHFCNSMKFGKNTICSNHHWLTLLFWICSNILHYGMMTHCHSAYFWPSCFFFGGGHFTEFSIAKLLLGPQIHHVSFVNTVWDTAESSLTNKINME